MTKPTVDATGVNMREWFSQYWGRVLRAGMPRLCPWYEKKKFTCHRENKMTQITENSKPIHKAALMHAEEVKAGKLSRREFLTRTTALGVSTVGAYGLLGLEAPANAASHGVKRGGTARIQMEVRAFKDPRTFDWTQIAFVAAGTLEYMVEYNNDGSFRGMLVESWERQ